MPHPPKSAYYARTGPSPSTAPRLTSAYYESCTASTSNIGHTNYNSPPYSNSSAPLQTSSIPREPQRTFCILVNINALLRSSSIPSGAYSRPSQCTLSYPSSTSSRPSAPPMPHAPVLSLGLYQRHLETMEKLPQRSLRQACLLLGQLSGTWGHVMSSLCVSSYIFRITLVHL
jgi:hypothetical protein